MKALIAIIFTAVVLAGCNDSGSGRTPEQIIADCNTVSIGEKVDPGLACFQQEQLLPTAVQFGDSTSKGYGIVFAVPAHAERLRMIVGDSVSLGYMAALQQMDPSAIHIGDCYIDMGTLLRADNAGNSARMDACMDTWLAGLPPQTEIHFNAGLHDLHIPGCGRGLTAHEVEISDYLMHLQNILDKIRSHRLIPIFATTTPVEGETDCHRNKDVIAYNSAAVGLMTSQGVEVDDLYFFMAPNITKYHGVGVHFTKAGYAYLAVFVEASLNQ